MPANLTDDPSSYPANIQVPAPGDPRTNTSVEVPFQGLANRTANATARLDTIVPASKLGYLPGLPTGVSVGSVPLIATSIAALQSIPAANRLDAMQAIVKDWGLYQFDITSVQAAQSPFVIQPTDIAGGSPGRWVLLPYGALNIANGLPQLDGSARLPAAVPRNGLIYDKASAGSMSTAGAIITGTPIMLTGLIAGDLIKASYCVSMTVATSHYASCQINMVDPILGSNIYGFNKVTGPSTGDVQVNGVGSIVVSNPGTWIVNLNALSDGTVASYQFAQLNVTVTRP